MHRGRQLKKSANRPSYLTLKPLVAIGTLVFAHFAQAGDTINVSDNLELRYSVISNYAVGIRVEQQAPEIVGNWVTGTTNPSAKSSYPDPQLPPLVALPTGRNADDGDKNFARGSVITNRISLLADMDFRYKEEYKLLGIAIKDPGIFLRASFHNDFKYTKGTPDNTDWSTLNNTTGPTEFTNAARSTASDLRLLDYYAYGRVDLTDDVRATVKVGSHSVQWGESFFFPNVSWATTRQDASKASQPGTEVKEVLAPTPQLSTQIDIGTDFSLLGYYKFTFRPTAMSPVGSYFSYADVVGPGTEFIVKGANFLTRIPAADSILGLLFDKNSTFYSPVDKLPYRGTIKPGNFGDMGLGTRFRPTDSVELGLYAINYHEKIPLPVMEYGYQNLLNLPTLGIPFDILVPPRALDALKSTGLISDTSILDQGSRKIPVGYKLRFFDNVKMLAGSFSSNIAGINFAGDLSYRHGVPVLVNTMDNTYYSKEFLAANPKTVPSLIPTAVRGNAIHANLNWLKLFGPTFIAPRTAFVGEFSYVHLLKHDKPDGNNDLALAATKSAAGFGTRLIFTYPGVYEGWDLEIPLAATYGFYGKSPINGALGAITGKNDFQGSLGVSMTYLDNLSLNLNYNAYLGKADLDHRPLADRDNVTFNVKYSF